VVQVQVLVAAVVVLQPQVQLAHLVRVATAATVHLIHIQEAQLPMQVVVAAVHGQVVQQAQAVQAAAVQEHKTQPLAQQEQQILAVAAVQVAFLLVTATAETAVQELLLFVMQTLSLLSLLLAAV
jgi:hypothetical protein